MPTTTATLTDSASDASAQVERFNGLGPDLVRKANSATNANAGRRVQEILERMDSIPNGQNRALAQECVEILLQLYGEGLGRIVRLIGNAGEEREQLVAAMLRDELVRSLLLVHNLHPLGMEERVLRAMDTIRPYLKSHGGNVELLELRGGVAVLRLQGTCKTCASSAVTLELAVRHAIEEACPDLTGFEVESDGQPNLTPIQTGSSSLRWQILENFEPLKAGELRVIQVDGNSIVVCRVGSNSYAFENRCAVCNAGLDGGSLEENVVRCASGHAFDIRRAGVSQEDSSVHLNPVPLLAVGQEIKIAVH